jgi:hypothetical protein
MPGSVANGTLCTIVSTYVYVCMYALLCFVSLMTPRSEPKLVGGIVT